MKRIIARFIVIMPALMLQVLWFFLLMTFYTSHAVAIGVIFGILSVTFVLNIIVRSDEPTYKVFWLIIIALLPVIGTWAYMTLGNKRTVRPIKKSIDKSSRGIVFNHNTDEAIINELRQGEKRYFQILNNISGWSKFPIKRIESIKYYPLGDIMLEDMKEELRKAEKFIYLEYFIIANGKFWNDITEILKEKASTGVDVRVMYDDIGSITTYGFKDIQKIREFGIKCIAFNRLMFITGSLNNRDHRKMMIIDGRVVFSGGINIADEYINEYKKYGHWKDIGFKLTGESVENYTYMFVEFWNAFSKDKIHIVKKDLVKNQTDNGYVLSYYDSPSNTDSISNNLYIELLEASVDYMYFYTPYLVLGDDLFKALKRTARRGVDVRIIMPGIPDKKIVFRLGKSYYKELMDAGVKIYEYTPGFVHAKATITDDKICTIGTVNLDYRSLFLHFENNSIFYESDVIKDLKKDYLCTLKKCNKIEKIEKRKPIQRFNDAFLRLISPLL